MITVSISCTIFVAAAASIAVLIRPLAAPEKGGLATELADLRNIRLWASLRTTIFGFAGVSVILTFIAPILGVAAFATIAPLQTRVVSSSPEAPALASSLNIAAFNLGNAGGAFLGGELIRRDFGYPSLAIAGALVTAIGMLLALAGNRSDRQAV